MNKLIIMPIKCNESERDYKAVYVTTKLDAMNEPNLVSVICQTTKEELLPKIDTISKQRILHNLYNSVCQ